MLLCAAAAAQEPELTLQGTEIWLGEVQLTSDGFNKSKPVWSPDAKHILYATLCFQGENCEPEAVILNRAGVQERRFPLVSLDSQDRCRSVMSIDWSPAGIGVDCHLNPSLGVYTVHDPNSGKPLDAYGGYGFVRSPDGRKVAHAGWVPHFSPPYAHSDTIKIDHKVVYPTGGSNLAQRDSADGNVWHGIHELRSPIVWSADGKSVALMERIYDWRQVAEGVPYDEGSFNERWQIVTVSLSGSTLASELDKPIKGRPGLNWLSPSRIRITAEDYDAVFEIRGKSLVRVP